jgi:SAM-dependent methyltransferase
MGNRAELPTFPTDAELAWGARLLRFFCRPVDAVDHAGGTAQTTPENALDFLLTTVPEFLEITSGKAVLDFGCGYGYQAAALAQRGCQVTGLDLPRTTFGETWKRLQAQHTNLVLTSDAAKGTFDVVYSCGSFEHFSDPQAILRLMRAYLRPGGTLVITFAEPWFSPRGSHMDGFTRLPWVNLLFSERDVLAVRSLYRKDGARRYEDVEGGLNRMTVARFERLIRGSGMAVVYIRLLAVKRLPLVTRVPLLRELFAASCTAVLVNR